MDATPMNELSINERPARRDLICALTEQGCTPAQVERRAHCRPTARRSALRKYRETGHHGDAPRSGRPKKHDARDDRELRRLVGTGRAKSAAEAARIFNSTRPKDKQLGVSTVQRISAADKNE